MIIRDLIISTPTENTSHQTYRYRPYWDVIFCIHNATTILRISISFHPIGKYWIIQPLDIPLFRLNEDCIYICIAIMANFDLSVVLYGSTRLLPVDTHCCHGFKWGIFKNYFRGSWQLEM